MSHLSPMPLTRRIASCRVGVMQCSWVKAGFTEHCAWTNRVGGSYVEEFARNLTEEKLTIAAARDALASADLTLELVIADHLRCDDPAETCETLRRDIQRWQAMGLTRFVTLRTGRGPTMADFLRTLEAAAAAVREAGLIPLTQNHRGGAVETPDELAACRDTGALLHFDTQQWLVVGHRPLDAWQQLGRDVAHVHLGDRDAGGQPVPFDQGEARMTDLLRQMHADGYRGLLTLETEHGPADAGAIPIVADAMAFVESVLAPLDAMRCQPDPKEPLS